MAREALRIGTRSTVVKRDKWVLILAEVELEVET
jgi:hypothetical protein